MEDRELLELAAKAAGIDLPDDFDGGSRSDLFLWNPLWNDGDALRLLAALELRITGLTEYIVKIETPNFETIAQQVWNEGKTAAIRRAIVRAAASIGKQIQNV